MVVSFPRVNEDGTLIGSEISCILNNIIAVEHLTRWALGEEHRDIEVMVPNCITIWVNDRDFDVLFNYDELKAMLKAFNEWDE